MTRTCPCCNSTNIVLIEYDYTHPEHYDGWSEIRCLDCNSRVGRWSNTVLEGDEYEYRYGKRK